MLQDVFEEKRSILEPAGALALAGAKAYCQYYGIKDEAVVAVTSGANMNFDRLRMVTELADVGARREAVLATFMPEEPGSFRKFQQMVYSISSPHSKRPRGHKLPYDAQCFMSLNIVFKGTYNLRLIF